MKFEIEINCDNDAFYDRPEDEVVRILQELRERIELGDADKSQRIALRDINGNTVGFARFTGERLK